jgi:hypothetical protein
MCANHKRSETEGMSEVKGRQEISQVSKYLNSDTISLKVLEG